MAKKLRSPKARQIYWSEAPSDAKPRAEDACALCRGTKEENPALLD